MALIKCPECGKEISDKATSCPGCGCPVEVQEAPVIDSSICEKSEEGQKVENEDFDELTATANSDGVKAKKKSKMLLPAICIGLIAIAGIVFAVIAINGKNEYKKLVGTWKFEVEVDMHIQDDIRDLNSLGIYMSDSLAEVKLPVYLQLNDDLSYVIFIDEDETNALMQEWLNECTEVMVDGFNKYMVKICEERLISEDKFEALCLQEFGMSFHDYILSCIPTESDYILREGEGIYDYGTWSIDKGKLLFVSARDFDAISDHAEYVLENDKLVLNNGHGYVYELLSEEQNTIYEFDNDISIDFERAELTRNESDISKSDIEPITEDEMALEKERWDRILLNNIKTILYVVMMDPYTALNDEASDYLHYISGERIDITAMTADENIFWHDVSKELFGLDGIYPGAGDMHDLSDMIFSDGATGKIYMTIKNGSLISLEIDGTDISY